MTLPHALRSPAMRLVALVALCGLAALFIISLASADPVWPTPPPAPAASSPRIDSEITRVEVPLGATSSVIQPILQGIIPAIPPLVSTIFEAPEHLKVTIEAGSLPRTIQLTYEPLQLDQAPDPARLQRLVRVFDLKSYDYQGREFQPDLLRPWIIEVPLDKLPGPLGDVSRLVFARFEDGRWTPLVTSLRRDDNVLVSRILKTGQFAILAELRPI